MVTIRAAVPDDITAVLSLWAEATGPSTTDDPDSLEHLLRFTAESLFVATDDEEIVGTVIAAWDGWRGTMYRLAVLPSRRRRGIASMLVQAGEASLRRRGATRLHLIVESDRPVAQSFWAAIGYSRTDQARYVKTFRS